MSARLRLNAVGWMVLVLFNSILNGQSARAWNQLTIVFVQKSHASQPGCMLWLRADPA
jgi:hypothetical protein